MTMEQIEAMRAAVVGPNGEVLGVARPSRPSSVGSSSTLYRSSRPISKIPKQYSVAELMVREAKEQETRAVVHKLVAHATVEQQRARVHERKMQDFVTEAQFQAALITKGNAGELKYAVRKLQAAIVNVREGTYSKAQVNALVKRAMLASLSSQPYAAAANKNKNKNTGTAMTTTAAARAGGLAADPAKVMKSLTHGVEGSAATYLERPVGVLPSARTLLISDMTEEEDLRLGILADDDYGFEALDNRAPAEVKDWMEATTAQLASIQATLKATTNRLDTLEDQSRALGRERRRQGDDSYSADEASSRRLSSSDNTAPTRHHRGSHRSHRTSGDGHHHHHYHRTNGTKSSPHLQKSESAGKNRQLVSRALSDLKADDALPEGPDEDASDRASEPAKSRPSSRPTVKDPVITSDDDHHDHDKGEAAPATEDDRRPSEDGPSSGLPSGEGVVAPDEDTTRRTKSSESSSSSSRMTKRSASGGDVVVRDEDAPNNSTRRTKSPPESCSSSSRMTKRSASGGDVVARDEDAPNNSTRRTKSPPESSSSSSRMTKRSASGGDVVARDEDAPNNSTRRTISPPESSSSSSRMTKRSASGGDVVARDEDAPNNSTRRTKSPPESSSSSSRRRSASSRDRRDQDHPESGGDDHAEDDAPPPFEGEDGAAVRPSSSKKEKKKKNKRPSRRGGGGDDEEGDYFLSGEGKATMAGAPAPAAAAAAEDDQEEDGSAEGAQPQGLPPPREAMVSESSVNEGSSQVSAASVDSVDAERGSVAVIDADLELPVTLEASNEDGTEVETASQSASSESSDTEATRNSRSTAGTGNTTTSPSSRGRRFESPERLATAVDSASAAVARHGRAIVTRDRTEKLEAAVREMAKQLATLDAGRAKEAHTEKIVDARLDRSEQRLQSVAEQVVKIIGTEHKRTRVVERRVESLEGATTRLDEDQQQVKHQLSRQHRQVQAQFDEILDSMNRYRQAVRGAQQAQLPQGDGAVVAAQTRSSSAGGPANKGTSSSSLPAHTTTSYNNKNHGLIVGEVDEMRNLVHRLEAKCEDLEDAHRMQADSLVDELRRHQGLYREILAEYTLVLNDSFHAVQSANTAILHLEGGEPLDSTAAAARRNNNARDHPLQLPLRAGADSRRTMMTGGQFLENLRLKHENYRLKVSVANEVVERGGWATGVDPKAPSGTTKPRQPQPPPPAKAPDNSIPTTPVIRLSPP